ncbi:hypothetical protein CTAYLR_009002 [Chrysophaeum taylorii]|uniref:Acid phosphatase n=1 Tax=Chrysophaeum taylorii TaxID=2483200 RepID=A0AAD7XT84_9STRA|nr:hypothetical protein CTAYLR_009002 [Chrysophaeum taylorii]
MMRVRVSQRVSAQLFLSGVATSLVSHSQQQCTETPVADGEWELRHVSAYFRHGARAPIYGVSHEGVTDCVWSACASCAAASRAVEADADRVVRLQSRDGGRAPESVVDAKQRRLLLPGGCRSGELTELGERQARELGSQLRGLYGDALAPRPERLSARTTNVARCVLSLRGVLQGLLRADAPVVPVDTVHASREWLTVASGRCARLRQLWGELGDPFDSPRSATKTAVYASLQAKIARAGVPLKDAMIARASLGAPLPWDLSDEELRALDLAAAEEVAMLIGVGVIDRATQIELLRLCAGRLVHELRSELVDAGPRTLRLVSGHDTTVKPLLVALDAYDHRWPPFCACVSIELYQHKDDATKRAVRVLYNGLTAPSVAGSAGDFYVVRDLGPLDDFLELLEPIALSPADFECACTPRDTMDNPPEQTAAATTGGSSF